MGIEFGPRTGDHPLQVEQLIRILQKHREEVPHVLVAEGRNTHPIPGAKSAESPELESSGDGLLELVRKGDSLTLEQFLWELKDQRLGNAWSHGPKLRCLSDLQQLMSKDIRGADGYNA